MSDIEITRLEDRPGEASLKVEIPVDLVQQSQKKAAQHYAKRARIPGFRKGKIPEAVVLRKFKDGINEAVIQDLMTDAWKKAVDQENLVPIADPRVKDLKFEDDEPVTFEMLIEVKPEVTLERTGGFELKRKLTAVTDDSVQAQLDNLVKQRAPWSPIEGEKPAPDDLVRATIAVHGGSDADAEEEEAKPVQFVLGDGSAIPEIEERLMAMAVGESQETSVRYPDDFPDEALRGQSRKVRLELLELKRQDLPAMDDDFAREVGEFETIEDLYAAIRDDLEAEAKREAEADVRRQVLELVGTANNVVAPEGMVQRVIAAFAEGYQVTAEQMPSFANDFRPVAESQVRRDLILDAVAEQQELKATEDDIDEKIAEIAAGRDAEPGEIYSSLQKANRLNELERSITEKKVFDFLLEQNTIIDES